MYKSPSNSFWVVFSLNSGSYAKSIHLDRSFVATHLCTPATPVLLCLDQSLDFWWSTTDPTLVPPTLCQARAIPIATYLPLLVPPAPGPFLVSLSSITNPSSSCSPLDQPQTVTLFYSWTIDLFHLKVIRLLYRGRYRALWQWFTGSIQFLSIQNGALLIVDCHPILWSHMIYRPYLTYWEQSKVVATHWFLCNWPKHDS